MAFDRTLGTAFRRLTLPPDRKSSLDIPLRMATFSALTDIETLGQDVCRGSWH